jgi:hypothetical protein
MRLPYPPGVTRDDHASLRVAPETATLVPCDPRIDLRSSRGATGTVVASLPAPSGEPLPAGHRFRIASTMPPALARG